MLSVRTGLIRHCGKDGEELKETPAAYFGADLKRIVSEAYNVERPNASIPIHFIRTKGGVAVIGAATIRPSSLTARVEERNLHVLVFARHLTPRLVTNLSKIYRIDGLALNSERDKKKLNVPLTDVSGRNIAFLSWPSKLPGSRSFLAVRTQLAVGCAILALFLAAIGVVGFVIIRKLREDEARSRHKALHDSLTGLSNRAALVEHLQGAVERADGSFIYLYLVDLDGFKGVNDTWGHAAGDSLLVAVAHKLRAELPPHALIARLGGDEFAIVTVGDRQLLEETDISESIQRVVSAEFALHGRLIQVGGSAGVSGAKDIDTQVGELMRTADVALYQAKDLGRGRTVIYEQALDAKRREQAILEHQLRRTLTRDGIDVHYQPLVDADSFAIRGVEALARWNSATLGTVRPDIFIPLAEKAGLIDTLGMQVIEKAVAATAQWGRIEVCVNVSPLQLQDQNFVRRVAATLDKAGFDPSRLTLEITEGVLIARPEHAHRAIDALKSLGVKIALDDFGIGYASIGALRKFGFDRMKIDKSLVSELEVDRKAPGIFQATVALANALEIPVTAEGIETNSQALIARHCGCDLLQGYLFSQPVTAEEISVQYFNVTQDSVSTDAEEFLPTSSAARSTKAVATSVDANI